MLIKAIAVAGIAISVCGVARADGLLGTATNYTILTVPGNSTLNLNNCSVTGDVGIGNGGHISLLAPATINGDLFLRNTTAAQVTTNLGTITGSILQNQLQLDVAIADANSGAATAAALAPTQTFGSITSNTTVFGNGGLNVIQINGNVNLSSTHLYFFGTADDIFIVNITGGMTLTGSAQVSNVAGAYDTHVLLNFTGASGTITSGSNTLISGTVLAPHYSANLQGTLGSIYAGAGLTMGISGAAKVHPTPFVPAPGTAVLLGMGGLLAARRRR